MSWSKLDLEKFAKIIALASSNRDGEALVALRKAEGMLSDVGLSFIDLADNLRKGERPAPAAAPQQKSQKPDTQRELALLARRIIDLHDKMNEFHRIAQSSLREAETWRNAAWEAARHICWMETEISRLRSQIGQQTNLEPELRLSELDIPGLDIEGMTGSQDKGQQAN